MKTESIRINSKCQGMDRALEVAEKLGYESGLEGKKSLHLRLLTEELVGMLRGIAGDVEADFYIEQDRDKYELHLNSDIEMDQELRRQLIAVSSEGKNQAAKGFMGKLKEMIAVMLLPDPNGVGMMSGLSLGLMSMGSPTAMQAGMDAYHWSMSEYKNEVKNASDKEAWDELEKSIVANIADDVSVSIRGSKVEIIIYKKF